MDCRIYVASLSDYNAGILHGEWMDVSDAETLQEQITAMLAKSPTAKREGVPAEEWAIHDFEGFDGLKLSEHESLEDICHWAEGATEHGDAFLAWAGNDPGHNKDVDDFLDAYAGEWDSLADYVEDYFEQSGDIPKAPKDQWFHPAHFIDWDRMAHDLELSGDVWTAEAANGKVFVFNSR
jgi:antirestriction protein